MPDYFTVLDEPRRPWLDAAALKAKFLALSTTLHPDRFHNATGEEKAAATQRYTELNAAYQTLHDPRDRLAHFLELELGHRPKDVQNIPNQLADRFIVVAQLCREVDKFLTAKRAVTSPLLQVEMFQRSQEWTDKLSVLLAQLAGETRTVEAELQKLDAGWPLPNELQRAAALEHLEALFRLLSYYGRWSTQLRERNAQLVF